MDKSQVAFAFTIQSLLLVFLQPISGIFILILWLLAFRLFKFLTYCKTFPNPKIAANQQLYPCKSPFCSIITLTLIFLLYPYSIITKSIIFCLDCQAYFAHFSHIDKNVSNKKGYIFSFLYINTDIVISELY